jgi:DNA primase
MFNIDQIKQSLDCRDIVELDLGAPKHHSSGVNMYKCPLHNETKGFSLAVYPDHWQCFGKCQTGGDAVAWLQKYHGLSFKEACQRLGGQVASKPIRRAPRPRPQESPAEPPSLEWQTAALKLVEEAETTLQSNPGKQAMDYLMHKRGLWPQTIQHARLGFIPGDYHEWREIHGLKVPCGILIPWICDGMVWAINVRRAAGDPKYQQVSGGHIRGALFMADEILPRWPVLFTEGEFDCLIVWQCAQDYVCPVTLGGASNTLHSRWFPQLVSSRKLLVVTDHDEAGDKAGARLQALSARTQRITVPNGKDFNDFYLDSNLAVVAGWVEGLVK